MVSIITTDHFKKKTQVIPETSSGYPWFMT